MKVGNGGTVSFFSQNRSKGNMCVVMRVVKSEAKLATACVQKVLQAY